MYFEILLFNVEFILYCCVTFACAFFSELESRPLEENMTGFG